MTYLGEDGREHREPGGTVPRDSARLRYVTRRSCDGWPELGSCSGHAMRGCGYCRECETLRRAHEGGGDLTNTEEEEDEEPDHAD